jgi:crossover junction endodeoxyribonuclease RuvC
VRVLGIDPGLQITGFGCVDALAGFGTVPTLVEAGVFRLGKGTGHEASGTGEEGAVGGENGSISARLVELDRDLRDLLERAQPDVVAVEGLFAHYKHPSTAIVMGHARGVILLAVRQAGARLIEYKPNEIKKAVAGYGHASKMQIQESIKDLYRLADLPTPADMADAIAIATCAAWREEVGTTIP